MKIDKEKTVFFYKNPIKDYLCNCDTCQYFYENIEKKHPTLKEYLKKYSIDITKPVEIINYIYEENKKVYEAFYLVCGHLEKEESLTNDNFQIAFKNRDSLYEINIDTDYFLVNINKIEL